METDKKKNLFIAVLLGMIVLMLMIVFPFINGLAWSVLFCVLVYPAYEKLLAKIGGKYENIAAGIITVMIICFMLVPMIWLLLFAISEIAKGYVAFVASGGLPAIFKNAIPYLQKIPLIGKHFTDVNSMTELPLFTKAVSTAFSWLTVVGQVISKKIAGGTAKLFLLLAVVGFSAFYFLRDGKRILSFIYDLLPLENEDKKDLFSDIREIILTIVYGLLLTSMVQGAVGAIGWYFAGLPNVIFFGFMMFIFGLIPMVGTTVVWGGGVLYLLILGDIAHALFLLFWGAGFICTIDNLVRPIFISGGSDLNMLVVFLGLLGGVYLWGFVGLVYGPLVLYVGLCLLEIYRKNVVKIGQSEENDKP